MVLEVLLLLAEKGRCIYLGKQRVIGSGDVLQKLWEEELEGAAASNDPCNGCGLRREREVQVFGQVQDSVSMEIPTHVSGELAGRAGTKQGGRASPAGQEHFCNVC